MESSIFPILSMSALEMVVIVLICMVQLVAECVCMVQLRVTMAR
jgi:hypothetical protein